jgi:hypothetical protein
LDWGLPPIPSLLCFPKPSVPDFPVHFCFCLVSVDGGGQFDSPVL